MWGRTPLAEIIGALEMLLSRLSQEDKDTIGFEKITKLRFLVGVSSTDEFIEQAKSVREAIYAIVPKGNFLYLDNALDESFELLENSGELEGYVDAYVASLLLDLTDQAIMDKEVNLFKQSASSQEAFASELMSYLSTFGDKARIEKSVGMEYSKLVGEIQAMTLHLSTLRRLCLLLELGVNFTATMDEQEPLIIGW